MKALTMFIMATLAVVLLMSAASAPAQEKDVSRDAQELTSETKRQVIEALINAIDQWYL